MSTTRVASRADRAIDAALWTAGLLFAGITLTYSLAVTPPQSEALSISDESLHIAAYFATGLCLLLAAVWRPGRGDGPFPTWGLRAAVALVSVGAAVELAQGLFTSRQAELTDVLADLIGAGAALGLHELLRRRAPAGT
jgi:VanZ family protein